MSSINLSFLTEISLTDPFLFATVITHTSTEVAAAFHLLYK